jgi:hypothetical protein
MSADRAISRRLPEMIRNNNDKKEGKAFENNGKGEWPSQFIMISNPR